MRFSVSAANVNELIEKTCQFIGATPDTGAQADLMQLPPSVGKGWVRHHKLRLGLELTVCDATIWEPTIREFEHPNELRLIGMDFCLKGYVQGTRQGVDRQFTSRSNQSSWGFSPGGAGTDEWVSRERMIVVEINIEPETFKTLVGDEFERLPHQLQQFVEGTYDGWHSQTNWMSPWMRTAAEQILNCPHQGMCQQLYLEAKVLELIAGYLELIRTNESSPEPLIYLSPEDMDCLHQSKEILSLELMNPPSLVELSQQVNLNQKKLNLGFRQLFGTTPFGYLSEQRMEQARILLETRKFNVTEVAKSVGYASLSAFNAAFRKRFGVNPSIVCGK